MRIVRIALVMMVAATARADSLKLGDKVPAANVKMKNVDGKEVSITDVAGPKGTLVMFSCNHCPFVKAWETRIAETGNAYMKKDIGVIVINSNDPNVQAPDGYAEMQKRAKERGFQFPYVVDATSDVARAFGASRTPEAFVFDAGGKLVYHGTVDDNPRDESAVKDAYLRNAVNAVASGKAVPVAETKSM